MKPPSERTGQQARFSQLRITSFVGVVEIDVASRFHLLQAKRRALAPAFTIDKCEVEGVVRCV
jgi:hypothetical protein